MATRKKKTDDLRANLGFSKEACKIIGCHPHTLRKYSDLGVIPCTRDARGIRIYDLNRLRKIDLAAYRRNNEATVRS